MTKTSASVDFEFDLLTEDGSLIAQSIPFRCTFTANEYPAEPDVGVFNTILEDIEASDIEINVALPTARHWQVRWGDTAWREMPAEMQPFFDRWMALADSQERIAEWLRDGSADHEFRYAGE